MRDSLHRKVAAHRPAAKTAPRWMPQREQVSRRMRCAGQPPSGVGFWSSQEDRDALSRALFASGRTLSRPSSAPTRGLLRRRGKSRTELVRIQPKLGSALPIWSRLGQLRPKSQSPLMIESCCGVCSGSYP